MTGTMDSGAAWIFLSAGLLFIGLAALFARRPWRLLRAGGRASGVVTGNDRQEVLSRRGPSSNRWMYFPIVAFTTADGREISIRSKTAGPRPTPLGKPVTLRYDPARPEQAELCTFATLWGLPCLCLVFALPLLFEGLMGLGVLG